MTATARKTTTMVSTILMLAVLVAPLALSFAATVTVLVDKPAYLPGQTLTVSGTVSPVTSGQDVAIQVYSPTGELKAVDQATPGSDGTYSKQVMTFAATSPSGTWSVKATYQGASASAVFTFTGVPPRTNIVLSVDVSSGSMYAPGDSVSAYILTSYGGLALDANVTAALYAGTTSTAMTVTKVSKGLYLGTSTLAAGAAAGTYNIFVNASVTTSQYLGYGLGLGSFQVTSDLNDIKSGITGVNNGLSSLNKTLTGINNGISDIKKNFPITVDISPIWYAVVLSLIAAIAAIYSTITVQRKIAG